MDFLYVVSCLSGLQYISNCNLPQNRFPVFATFKQCVHLSNQQYVNKYSSGFEKD